MKYFSVIFLLFPNFIFSQVKVTFEEGNLNNWQQFPPNHWALSSSDALEGIYSLHHTYDNSEDACDRISCLHNPLYLDSAKCRWYFSLKYDYLPSSANNWAVFIAADRPAAYMHPDSSINAYILGVNFSGSDDMLKLWKLTNMRLTTIVNTGFNWQTGVSGFHKTLVSIERNENGIWSIFIDTTGSGNSFVFLDDGQDNEIKISNYFGIYYKYTSTQDRKLAFDELEINGFFKNDNSLLSIKDIRCTSFNEICVEFSKPVNTDDLNTLLITVSDDIGNPASIKANSPVNISLYFKFPFQNRTNYELCIIYVEDIYGKGQSNIKFRFDFYIPMPYDILINEIMADPEPSVGLPGVEYIELFNTTDYDIPVSGWALKAGDYQYALPDGKIEKKNYVFLCEKKNASLLEDYNNVWGLTKFPALNNDGQTISLTDREGKIMHSVSYKTKWYKNLFKADGGWSLELIDSKNPCGGFKNWKASESYSGGTPGFVNSVNAENPDYENPLLLRAASATDSSIVIYFNEPLNFGGISDPSIYSVDQDIFHPVAVFPVPPDYSRIQLNFSKKFELNKKYKIVIKDEVCDCVGNHIKSSHTYFAMASLPDSFDLIINEILFESDEDDEFIEIYNRSDKNIELMGIKLALLNKDNAEIKKLIYEMPFNFQLFPGQFFVITGNLELLTKNYYCKDRLAITESEKSLLLPDKEGIIAILDKNYKIIDKFYYNSDYHYKLLRNTIGVSLERLFSDQPTNYEPNWHSAAEDAGFATPGYENSQSFNGKDNNSAVIWLESDVFTPDNDGRDDYLTIHYKFDHPGYNATVLIFNSRGRIVNQLADNMMLGEDGLLIWDGVSKEGIIESPGIYILYFQAYTIDGKVSTFKKSFVLARKTK